MKERKSILGRMLGWYEPDPALENLGPIWNRWEEVWCKALDWNDCELKELWKLQKTEGSTGETKSKGSKTGAVDALHIIRPTTVESEWNRQIALYLFYQKFRRAYVMASQKTDKNKKMNTMCKERFIYLLFWSIIIHAVLLIPIYIVLLVKGFSTSNLPMFVALIMERFSTSHVWMTETFVVAALVLVALIFAKNLDIQKYQETWARHTRFQYHREQEMLRFLLEAEPYNQPEANQRVDTFVKAIQAIEEKNIEKFCTNMEEKEKGMMEEILAAAKKKGLIP